MEIQFEKSTAGRSARSGVTHGKRVESFPTSTRELFPAHVCAWSFNESGVLWRRMKTQELMTPEEHFEEHLALIKRVYERMQRDDSWPWDHDQHNSDEKS